VHFNTKSAIGEDAREQTRNRSTVVAHKDFLSDCRARCNAEGSLCGTLACCGRQIIEFPNGPFVTYA